MAEAELRIKPVVAGRARWRAGVRSLRSDVGSLGRQMRADLGRGVRDARRLESALERSGRAARSIGSGVSGLIGSVASLRNVVAGVALGGAGATLIDKMIGSNAKLEAQRITFNTLVGDTQKAERLMGRVRAYAAATPFQQDELIEGSKALLRLTGANADENMRLLRIAGKFAAINPSKTVGDAVEAILDAEGGEFERLKEFGVKLSKKDVEKLRQTGESMGTAALRGVEEALTKQTGGRDPVEALSKSFNGKLSTFSDNFSEFMRRAGEPAFEVLRDNLDDVGEAFRDLGADPQFKKDVEELAEFGADLAKSSVTLAKQMPGYIRDLRAFGEEWLPVVKSMASFASEHRTALGVGAGLYAANRATGGAVARGGASLAAGGVRLAGRALFGRRGGRAAGALSGAGAGAAGAMPVSVVNMGEGGGLLGAAGDALGAGAGAAGAGAGGAGLTGYTASSAGLVGTIGAGATAATVGAGAAAIGVSALGGWRAAQGTARINKIVDERARVASEERDALMRRRMAYRLDDLLEPLGSRIDRQRENNLSQAMTTLGVRGVRRGGGAAKFRFERGYQLAGPQDRQAYSERLNEELASYGVSASFEDGRFVASARDDAGLKGRLAAAELNRSRASRPDNYVPGLAEGQTVTRNIVAGLKGVFEGLTGSGQGMTVIVQGDLTERGARELERIERARSSRRQRQ